MSRKTIKGSTGEWYNIDTIRSLNAAINMIFGARSRGKTTQMLAKIVLLDFWNGRKEGKTVQAVYLRRRREDIKTLLKQTLFDTLKDTEWDVYTVTGGEYSGVTYYKGGWYLCNIDPETGLTDRCEVPLLYDIALNTWYHDKGTPFKCCKHLWFEECCAAPGEPYLDRESYLFQQVISTVLRQRDDTYVWMTGNAIDYLCPHFEAFGIDDVVDMPCGTIRKYKLGKTGNIIAVERTNDRGDPAKPEKTYRFAFDDNAAQSIVKGDFEIGLFPLIDEDVVLSEKICARYMIKYKKYNLYCDIVQDNTDLFIYCHRDPDPLHPIDELHDLIYSLEFSPKQNYRRAYSHALSEPETLIWKLVTAGKLFFSDNFTGSIHEHFMRDSM